MIFLDTSILIDFYRKQKKERTFFYQLIEQNHSFAISSITEYEIYVGSNGQQDQYWAQIFDEFTILPLTSEVSREAVNIYRQLKRENKMVEIPDLLIGATAKFNGLPVVTLNKKHFERIKGLEFFELNK